MDEFTQRMLERAKLRREKLDSYMSNTNGNTNKNTNGNTNTNTNGNTNTNSNIDTNRKVFKSKRLADLATKINTWEDDVDHPQKPISRNQNTSKVGFNFMDVEKEQCKGKGLKVLRLKIKDVAPFQSTPTLHITSVTMKENKKNSMTENKENKRSENSIKMLEKSMKSPEPSVRSPVPKVSNVLSPKMGVTVLKDSSVLKKAALFEKKSSPVKTLKDPAELSLKERRALFEKNKGEVLLPKVAFGTALPAKKIMLSEQKEPPVKRINEIIEKKITEISQNSYAKKKIETSKPIENMDVQPAKDEQKTIFNKPSTESLKEDKVPEPVKGFQNSPEVLKIVKEVKKIDVVPEKILKTDRLYPCLSDIESVEESDCTSSDGDSLNASKNSNIYLNMSFGDIIEATKNNPVTPPNNHSLESNECRVLNQMDDLLDEALGDISSSDEDSPTPPKMLKSMSFEYKSNPEDNPSNQLIHTVSFYRKQQQIPSQSSTPAKVIKREEEISVEDKTEQDETALVEEKIQNLLVEINTQQTQISQASQALNLCLSTVEFSGSKEQIEFERVLLLASHKRQACLNEVHRLKVENSLRPKNSVSELTERGNVTVKEMKPPLKREAVHSMAAAESMLYFVCLVKSDEQVLATSAVPAKNLTQLTLHIPDEIKLINLSSDFKVTIEIYYLELNKELLPHDIKYHISGKKDKKLLTPIKNKKSESKLARPCIQSPAGPNAVRTSNFQMCGFFVFSLREISKKQWTLNKVPYTSPLEGSISLSIETQLRFDSVFNGFLTMFDDISGFGAWHRRWCRLASEKLSYWKYPDDENTKVPIGSIDLRAVVTENVGIVSRDICARLHTFLLETTRPKQENDQESLVLNIQGDVTKIRHLLSADSKEEMLEWCRKLNRILALLRSWKCMK